MRATGGSFHGEANVGGLDQDCDLDTFGEAEVLDVFAGDGGGDRLSTVFEGHRVSARAWVITGSSWGTATEARTAPASW